MLLKECLYPHIYTWWSTYYESLETAFWTCASRILVHHATFKPTWTNAFISLPLWFHVMEYLEMKPRYAVLQILAGSLDKKSGSPLPKLRTTFTKSRMSIATSYETHIYASNDHAPPLWAEWANIPSRTMEPASACSTIWRTTNVSQNWRKGFTQNIASRTPEKKMKK